MTMSSEKGNPQSQRRENILFYTTAFFVLLATFSLFAFLFLVPFFIEPALSTLYMGFDPTPVTCETIEAEYLRGASKCNWSSCREGCTKDIFECWHIRVRYHSPIPLPVETSASSKKQSVPSSVSSASLASSPSSAAAGSAPSTDQGLKSLHYNTRQPGQSRTSDRLQSVLPSADESKEVELMSDQEHNDPAIDPDLNAVRLYMHEAKLQPNVKGCGYPPDVECNNTFGPTYGVLGNNFSCYYSTVDPTLAITYLNFEEVHAHLFYCLTIPILLFVVSVVYLFYAYFKVYAEDPAEAAAAAAGLSSGGISASASVRASANFAHRSPSNFACSPVSASKIRSDLAVEDVVIERPTSPSARLAANYLDSYEGQPYSPHQRHRHSGQRVVRRAKSGGTIATPLPPSTPGGSAVRAAEAARGQCQAGKSSTGSAAGMRLSKSMGPRVGECCVADGRPACSYLSPSSSTCSTTSSASSTRSSTSSSASSSSASSSSSSTASSAPSSPSRVPETLTSSRSSLASAVSDSLASISTAAAVAAAAADVAHSTHPPAVAVSTDQAIQLNHPSPSSSSANVATTRRRPRECVPLISKN